MFYTGDGAERDEHGYIWIKGRVDGVSAHTSQSARIDVDLACLSDVINVAGHRMSTAEIESALILHPGVAETAGLSHSHHSCSQCGLTFLV
jgi:acetyl-CoA synthetase